MAIRVATLDKLSRGSTIKIAAHNAHEKSKQVADYVCNGENDLDIFTQAIAELVSVGGGTLELSEGRFNLESDEAIEIEIWHDITIKGQGTATLISLYEDTGIWIYDGNTGFRDLQISASSNYAITYRGGGYHFLDKVYFNGRGIQYYNTNEEEILLINDCKFNCYTTCMFVEAGNVYISNSTIKSSTSYTAVDTQYDGSISMNNCIVNKVDFSSTKTHRIVNSKLDEVYAGDDVYRLIFVGNECNKLDAPAGGVVRPTEDHTIANLNHITIITLRE